MLGIESSSFLEHWMSPILKQHWRTWGLLGPAQSANPPIKNPPPVCYPYQHLEHTMGMEGFQSQMHSGSWLWTETAAATVTAAATATAATAPTAAAHPTGPVGKGQFVQSEIEVRRSVCTI